MELHPLAAGCTASQALAAWDWHRAVNHGGCCIGLRRDAGLATIGRLAAPRRNYSRASPAPKLPRARAAPHSGRASSPWPARRSIRILPVFCAGRPRIGFPIFGWVGRAHARVAKGRSTREACGEGVGAKNGFFFWQCRGRSAFGRVGGGAGTRFFDPPGAPVLGGATSRLPASGARWRAHFRAAPAARGLGARRAGRGSCTRGAACWAAAPGHGPPSRAAKKK